MDMHWLDDVLVLLEEGNMTRAAARRNITQPAFSRRIRGFEDWLGVTVLQRGTNRVDISAALVSNEVEIRALVAASKIYAPRLRILTRQVPPFRLPHNTHLFFYVPRHGSAGETSFPIAQVSIASRKFARLRHNVFARRYQHFTLLRV